MQSIKELLKTADKEKFAKQLVDKHKYVTREFQDYGYRVAMKLDDKKNASLYIKLAKDRKRAHLEQALSFVSDYNNPKNKPRLFMWKLKQLEDEYKKSKEDNQSVVGESNKQEISK